MPAVAAAMPAVAAAVAAMTAAMAATTAAMTAMTAAATAIAAAAPAMTAAVAAITAATSAVAHAGLRAGRAGSRKPLPAASVSSSLRLHRQKQSRMADDAKKKVLTYLLLAFALSSVFYYLILSPGKGKLGTLTVMGLMWCPGVSAITTVRPRAGGRSSSSPWTSARPRWASPGSACAPAGCGRG